MASALLFLIIVGLILALVWWLNGGTLSTVMPQSSQTPQTQQQQTAPAPEAVPTPTPAPPPVPEAPAETSPSTSETETAPPPVSNTLRNRAIRKKW